MKLLFFACLLSVALLSQGRKIIVHPRFPVAGGEKPVGGVYVMTNDLQRNSIVAYSRLYNGTLVPMGSFATGGKGAILDDFDDIDPLFSAYALIVSPDNRYVIAVNAGSRSVSVFVVLSDFSLRLTDVKTVAGFGPVSVAYSNGLVYVASAEASKDPADFSIFGSKGVLTGFRLTSRGKLLLLRGSVRELTNRPAALQFSPDGRSLVVSSFPTGSVQLDSDAVEELVVYKVGRTGLISPRPVSVATSTKFNNPEGRNLPSAIGFDMAQINGVQYVVVGEARVFTPIGEMRDFQTSSVSIWKLTSSSQLIPSQLDLLVGSSVTDGERATCWVEFSKSQNAFWVSNTISGTVSSFSFKNGRAELVDQADGMSTIPIDLWRSADGKFLYQLTNGAVDVFRVSKKGFGTGLTAIQTVTGIPAVNVQGIAAI